MNLTRERMPPSVKKKGWNQHHRVQIAFMGHRQVGGRSSRVVLYARYFDTVAQPGSQPECARDDCPARRDKHCVESIHTILNEMADKASHGVERDKYSWQDAIHRVLPGIIPPGLPGWKRAGG